MTELVCRPKDKNPHLLMVDQNTQDSASSRTHLGTLTRQDQTIHLCENCIRGVDCYPDTSFLFSKCYEGYVEE